MTQVELAVAYEAALQSYNSDIRVVPSLRRNVSVLEIKGLDPADIPGFSDKAKEILFPLVQNKTLQPCNLVIGTVSILVEFWNP